MLTRIKDFFNENLVTGVKAADESPSNDKVAIATCALLLEMAHTDAEFSDIEEEEIKAIIQSRFGLSEDKVKEIIELSNLELEESLDLWQFTNLINENFSKDEKIKVIEYVWQVIYADEKVDKYEDYLIRKLSYLLSLDHKDMIDAKLKVKNR